MSACGEHPDFVRFMEGNLTMGDGGEPVPFYHGTNRSFRSFSLQADGERMSELWGTRDGLAVGGHWFSTSPETASAYAAGEGGNVHKVYLRITRPQYITGGIQEWDLEDYKRYIAWLRAAIRAARSEGYDAVVKYAYDGIPRPTVQVVVFDAKTQIRGLDERYALMPPYLGSRSHA